MRVTVSSKYQIVIPQKLRKMFNIQQGEKIELIPYENRIEFIPVKNIESMRGFIKGIDTTIEREGDRA